MRRLPRINTRNSMTSFPNSPRLLKGRIVLVDPDSGAVQKIIVLQYNLEIWGQIWRSGSNLNI